MRIKTYETEKRVVCRDIVGSGYSIGDFKYCTSWDINETVMVGVSENGLHILDLWLLLRNVSCLNGLMINTLVRA